MSFIFGLIMAYFVIKFLWSMVNESAYRTEQEQAQKKEEERVRSIQRADEVRRRAVLVLRECKMNAASIAPTVSTTYKASSLMEEIINEINSVGELQSKINCIADGVVAKGGTIQ